MFTSLYSVKLLRLIFYGTPLLSYKTVKVNEELLFLTIPLLLLANLSWLTGAFFQRWFTLYNVSFFCFVPTSFVAGKSYDLVFDLWLIYLAPLFFITTILISYLVFSLCFTFSLLISNSLYIKNSILYVVVQLVYFLNRKYYVDTLFNALYLHSFVRILLVYFLCLDKRTIYLVSYELLICFLSTLHHNCLFLVRMQESSLVLFLIWTALLYLLLASLCLLILLTTLNLSNIISLGYTYI